MPWIMKIIDERETQKKKQNKTNKQRKAAKNKGGQKL